MDFHFSSFRSNRFFLPGVVTTSNSLEVRQNPVKSKGSLFTLKKDLLRVISFHFSTANDLTKLDPWIPLGIVQKMP